METTTREVEFNYFAPTHSHEKQREVMNDPARFKVLRAGRKWRKTSLLISWLMKTAMITGLVCPYVAPSRVQAKNIVWRDHMVRLITELRNKGIPHKVNESELSVSLFNNGKVQLLGVENREALRGISNWGAFAGDEVDDWQDDIWPTIIRPNLITHKAPAIMAGTPKGEGILFNMSQQDEFKEFHYTSADNPEIDREELAALEKEYRSMGEDYYRQEILAEYVMPVGLVYREWPDDRFIPLVYDDSLPLYISLDFGVNDPTAVIWLQRQGHEFRVIDYYEASDADINHFIDVIKSKPYKGADMVTGDPAGKARTLTTGTSPIDDLARAGIYVQTRDGIRIPEQIRACHRLMGSLFINSNVEGCEYFRRCLRNYRYPDKKSGYNVGTNEIPIHNWASHAMRALEYFSLQVNPTWGAPEPEIKSVDQQLKDNFWKHVKEQNELDVSGKRVEYADYENYSRWYQE